MKNKMTLMKAFAALILCAQIAHADTPCTQKDLNDLRAAGNVFLGADKLSQWLDKVKPGGLSCSYYNSASDGINVISICGDQDQPGVFSMITLSNENSEVIFGLTETTNECSQAPRKMTIESLNVTKLFALSPWVFGYIASPQGLTVQLETGGCANKSSYDLVGFKDSLGKDHITFLFNQDSTCLMQDQKSFSYGWNELNLAPTQIIDVR